MFNVIRYILLLTFYFTNTDCQRVKRKANDLVQKTKETANEKKSDLEDKIIARFDAYEPDTKFNKKRFSEFFGFYPPQDIKNIYCHADEMGIDHQYQFSFVASFTSINRIISNLALEKSNIPISNSTSFSKDFPWWDGNKLLKLPPYWKKGKHEVFTFLWYDSTTKKAYYNSYDM